MAKTNENGGAVPLVALLGNENGGAAHVAPRVFVAVALKIVPAGADGLVASIEEEAAADEHEQEGDADAEAICYKRRKYRTT